MLVGPVLRHDMVRLWMELRQTTFGDGLPSEGGDSSEIIINTDLFQICPKITHACRYRPGHDMVRLWMELRHLLNFGIPSEGGDRHMKNN